MYSRHNNIITAFQELALCFVEGHTTNDILARMARVLRNRFGLVRGEIVVRRSAFRAAEGMLGIAFRPADPLGKWDMSGYLDPGLADVLAAEVVDDAEMEDRYPGLAPACETRDGVSRIRVRLLHRQAFFGFFVFERAAEDPAGEMSQQISALLGVFGAILADVAETRTTQRLERERLMDQNRQLKSRLEPVSDSLVGESDAMREVYAQIRQVAPTDATVLVRGSSGTGKELVARSLVDLSPRKGRPFLTVNCAALPETLIESELFGHEKGAFTGAVSMRKGRFEQACGGTIFLDEVGELALATQAKLLRVLQERSFERLGGMQSINVDVRVIAATNRNLEQMVEEGTFRRDLFYRLNVFPIVLPPLRSRQDDILPLASHFAARFARRAGKVESRLSLAAMDMLQRYSWPGNIRELENAMERAVLLVGSQNTILPQHLPPAMHACGFNPDDASSQAKRPVATLDQRIAELERITVTEALEASVGQVGKAAEALGLTPRVLALRLKKYGIRYKNYRKLKRQEE